MEEVEILFQNKKIEKLFENIPKLIEFQKFYEKVKYLEIFKNTDFQEQFLYETYEPTMKIAGTSSRAFKDFTKENYDTFSRLKWKWINSTLAKKPQ